MFRALFLAVGLLVVVPAQAEEPKIRGPIETVEDAAEETFGFQASAGLSF